MTAGSLPDRRPDRRMLLVHAHPDDESINNGATMAKYVAEGAQVTLITCTLGEEGEVLVDELAHLAADRDDAEPLPGGARPSLPRHRHGRQPGGFRDDACRGAQGLVLGG